MYCPSCKRSVAAEREWNTVALVLLILFSFPIGIIYAIVKRHKRCPICKTKEGDLRAPKLDQLNAVSVTSKLQELCGGNEELYRALSNLMFLDPKKITVSLETVLSEARDFELNGNNIRAEVSYRTAGGVSLYKGDPEGVRSYFSKASLLAGDSRLGYMTLAKRADEAVSVARKYYEISESLRF